MRHRRAPFCFHLAGRRLALTCLMGTLGLIPPSASAQPVPDRDTLLLVQFDRSADADYAIGTATADTRITPTGPTAGRFGAGVDMAPRDTIAWRGDDGNFHPPQGTIDFWVKPHWPGDDPETHRFVSCRMGEEHYLNVNCLGGGRLGIAIAAGEGDQWTWRRADAHVRDWKAATWHHVAFAWGQGRLHVYVDGEEGPRTATDAQMPGAAPETITLTADDAAIDAFRISKRRFTAADARAAIQKALHPPYRYASDLAWQPADRALLDEWRLLGDVGIPLILDGRRYAKGIACAPGSEISTRLAEPFRTFEANVGVCPLSPAGASCSFEVWGDGEQLFDSGPRTLGQEPLPIRVEIAGVEELRLVTRRGPAATGVRAGHGIWAGAVLRRTDDEVLHAARKLDPAEIDMYRRQVSADDYTFLLDSASPFLVAAKCWEDEIDPARPPASGDVGRPLEAFAAPGEYEPVNFVVYAVADLDELTVEVTDLRCGDSRLPSGRVELSKEYPEFEFLATHMDEIFGRERMPRYIAFTEAVRQVPSLRVYITLHNDPKRDVADMMRRCDPYVDVRCYNGHCMDSWIRAGNTFEDLRRELEASGDEAWLYHNIRGAFFPAEWTRLVNGYYLWTSPLKVHVPWMYYSVKGNPFDATDGPRLRGGDFAYAAPHPDDPSEMVPTRHWVGFREGVDDMRYLATLEALIAEHADTPEAADARTWLDNLRPGVTPPHADLEPIEEESPLLVRLARKLDGPDYRRLRRQAAEHIVRLAALGR